MSRPRQLQTHRHTVWSKSLHMKSSDASLRQRQQWELDIRQNVKLVSEPLAAGPGAGWADCFWPGAGCRDRAWNMGGVDQPTSQRRRSHNQNASIGVLQWPHPSNGVRCDWPVELRLWSSSWEGRNPEGPGEDGRADGKLLPAAAPVDAPGTMGGSNIPKASCHSLLNSSPAPGPGLRRSLRKAMSPRSPSSSSSWSPVPTRSGEAPERGGSRKGEVP